MDNITLINNWINERNFYGKGDNMLYHGAVIYSYGDHFPIARIIGNNTVLFTYQTYNVATEKHKQLVESACAHLNKIYCNNPLSEHDENVYLYIINGLQALKGIEKARNTERFITESKFYYDNLQKYLSFFDFQLNKKHQKEFELWQSVLSSENTKETYIKKQKERAEKERAEREKREKQAVQRWLNFETNAVFYQLERDYIRFNKETQRIETSKGVEIPYEIARRFQNDLTNGAVEPGYKLLHYAVNKINDKTVQMGCHTFPLNYLKEFQF